jgi:hypothetical protein
VAKRKTAALDEDDGEFLDAFYGVPLDPVYRFLDEVSDAETQQEAADLLIQYRDLLRSLSREGREYVLDQVNEIVDKKPTSISR